jgi:hypothetical protein
MSRVTGELVRADGELVLPIAAHGVVAEDQNILRIVVKLLRKTVGHAEKDMGRLGRPIM